MAYQDSNVFDNLPPGTYSINVRDSFGEIKSQSNITIHAAPVPTPNAPVISPYGDSTHLRFSWPEEPYTDSSSFLLDISEHSDFHDYVGFGRGSFYHDYNVIGNITLISSIWYFDLALTPDGTYYVRLRAHSNLYNTTSGYSNVLMIVVGPIPP